MVDTGPSGRRAQALVTYSTSKCGLIVEIHMVEKDVIKIRFPNQGFFQQHANQMAEMRFGIDAMWKLFVKHNTNLTTIPNNQNILL